MRLALDPKVVAGQGRMLPLEVSSGNILDAGIYNPGEGGIPYINDGGACRTF